MGRTPLRTALLNAMAEFIGAAIYSALFLIFMARHVAAHGSDTSLFFVAYSIGIAYFLAVYIPFHTYRIHILPFITLMEVVRKRRPRVLFHKIPAQMAGAAVGTGLYSFLNTVTPFPDVAVYASTTVNEPFLAVVGNALGAFALCYAFYLVRTVFRQRNGVGTLMVSLVVAALFMLLGRIDGVTVLNPFGLMWLRPSATDGIGAGLFFGVLAQWVLPLAMSVLAYYVGSRVSGRRHAHRPQLQGMT